MTDSQQAALWFAALVIALALILIIDAAGSDHDD